MAARPQASRSSRHVAALVQRARAAQGQYQRYTQAQVDDVVTAAGWAIMKPENNRVLADLAVADSGLGNARGQVRQELPQDPGPAARPAGGEIGGRDRRYPQLG